MGIYAGYGFSVKDINPEEWVRIVKEKDPDMYSRMKEAVKDAAEGELNDAEIEAEINDNIVDLLKEQTMGLGDYLRDLINSGERKYADGEDVVDVYDEYVCFASLRFAQDEARGKLYPTVRDFTAMVVRYTGCTDLCFGNVWASGDGYGCLYFYMEN